MALPDEEKYKIMRALDDFEKKYKLLSSKKITLKELLISDTDYERFCNETGVGKNSLNQIEEIFEIVNQIENMTDHLLLNTYKFLMQDNGGK